MRETNQDKVKFWSEHLAAAASYPQGIGAYCGEHGLSTTMYYKWKAKLAQAKSVKVGAFLPVTVSTATEFRGANTKVYDLPEARWVAGVMLHLIRGLS